MAILKIYGAVSTKKTERKAAATNPRPMSRGMHAAGNATQSGEVSVALFGEMLWLGLAAVVGRLFGFS